MSETTNLGLFKHENPATNTNQFDIETSLNENWDKIDEFASNIDNSKVDKVVGKGLSTNDFTNEHKSKLEGLENYDDTQVKSDIQEIKSQYYTKEEIEKVIDTKEVEGTEIHIEDAKEFNMIELSVEGKSEQKSRSGRNKFDLSKIANINKFVKTETGVNLDSCWGAAIYSNENVLKTFKPNTAYTMKAKVKVVSRPSTQIYSQNDLFALYRPASSAAGSAFVPCLKMDDKYTVGLNTEKEYILAFTTPDDLSDLVLVTYTFYGNNDGATTGASSGEIDISEIMLVEGTYTADNFPDYEQYGASPSPEFPSEIENVKGWNLIDYKTVLNTDNNTIVTLIDNGFNTKGLYGGKIVVTGLKKNTDYRLQYILQNIIGNTHNVTVFANQETTTAIKHFTTFTGGIFNTGNYTEINIWFYGAVGTYGEANFTNIQLVEGSEEKPYAPFNSLAIEDVGKNYFDASKINNSNVVVSDNGKTITMPVATSGNGYITTQKKLSDLCPNLKVRDVVTLRFNRNLGYTYNCYIYLQGNINETWIVNTSKTITQEMLDDTVILYGNAYNQGETGQVILTDFSIMKSTETDTTWEPYKSQTEAFPLAEPLRNLSNETKDVIKEGSTHKIIGMKVFDGTENWIALNKTYYIQVSDKRSNKEFGKNSLLSSHFKQTENMESTGVISKGFMTETYYVSGNKNVFFNYDNGVGGVDNWKAYLAEQYAAGTPVILEYELETEVVEPFTDKQKTSWNKIKSMKLFEGVNNITVNATIKPNIRFKYAQDLKKRIERIEQLLTTEETVSEEVQKWKIQKL